MIAEQTNLRRVADGKSVSVNVGQSTMAAPPPTRTVGEPAERVAMLH